MSVISRQTGMTRGMIQYYFPTFDDIWHASIPHLNSEWQKKYFCYIREGSGKGDRLEIGIRALWRLMQDPLHVAKQELTAAARSNAALNTILLKEERFGEASTLEKAKQTYPDLAMRDEKAFRNLMEFTIICLEGLARHRFSKDAESRVDVLLRSLKSYVVSYWQSRGISIPQGKDAEKSSSISTVPDHDSPETAAMADHDRGRALSLVLKAAAILSRDTDDPEAE